MASIVAHVWPALAAVPALRRPEIPARLWVLGAACTVLPDADVAAIPLGIPYGDVLAHRGLTHSLAFAAVLAGFLTFVAFRGAPPGFPRGLAFAYLFLATASHGVLDAATNGGIGIAFFAPFDEGRYHLPFRPIEVSPIGVERFFSERGVRILANELVWVGLPSLAFGAGSWAWRRRALR